MGEQEDSKFKINKLVVFKSQKQAAHMKLVM